MFFSSPPGRKRAYGRKTASFEGGDNGDNYENNNLLYNPQRPANLTSRRSRPFSSPAVLRLPARHSPTATPHRRHPVPRGGDSIAFDAKGGHPQGAAGDCDAPLEPYCRANGRRRRGAGYGAGAEAAAPRDAVMAPPCPEKKDASASQNTQAADHVAPREGRRRRRQRQRRRGKRQGCNETVARGSGVRGRWGWR